MLQDIYTVFWRDWIVLRRRLVKFLLSRMVAPLLYLIAFGLGLGKSVQVAPGMSYLDFLVPGILALNSMNISFNSVGPTLHTARVFHKSLEEYLVAPIDSWAFVLGKVLAGTLRGLLSSLIIMLLSYAFGAHFWINGWFLLALGLNCAIFASLGFIAAMTIQSHEDMGSFNTYVLLPMSFLCGTFFRTEHLPALCARFIELLPLTHASVLLRGIGLQRGVDWSAFAALAFYAVLFLLLSRLVMERVRR